MLIEEQEDEYSYLRLVNILLIAIVHKDINEIHNVAKDLVNIDTDVSNIESEWALDISDHLENWI